MERIDNEAFYRVWLRVHPPKQEDAQRLQPQNTLPGRRTASHRPGYPAGGCRKCRRRK